MQDPRRHEAEMWKFSREPGIMVSFEHPLFSEGKFSAFHGWNLTNDKFRANNVSYIVRIEFSKRNFKENRIKRHFKRFWLPGALWVERNTRDQNIYNR